MISHSSLPGLTRQSMLSTGLLRLTHCFGRLHLSMDHRVKPGGDEGGGVITSVSEAIQSREWIQAGGAHCATTAPFTFRLKMRRMTLRGGSRA
jgi:hypothetical protein